MSTFALRRQAVANFPMHEMADPEHIKALRRKWLRSVEQLGSDWLLRKPVKRLRIKRAA